jgi:tetratricopeptide (TPR) repeat protein
MGIVLDAYDPRLDRSVALKLLHPELSTADPAADRLTREARAMAKVAHPNVVAVYEVGRTDGQVFVAMERVDGTTLRDWLGIGIPDRVARGWREIVEMFVAAGRGLAAAHAAGLVHRDFKPDNVLIGRDGRPRVGDFGLVVGGSAHPLAATGSTLAGTPAYMAPEQWRDEAIGPATDQFAWCVALWEALCGRRPFEGATAPTIREATCRGALPPKPRAIPGWLDAALRRGLATAPEDRWPSLTALLAHVEHHMRRRGRLIAATVPAALVASATAAYAVSAQPARDPCPAPDAQIAHVWSPSRRDGMIALASRLAGGELATRAAKTVDREAAAWRAMHREACRATRVEATQSDSLFDARMRCLDGWRAELADTIALVETSPDGEALDRALGALFELAPLARCADRDRLARISSMPVPAGQRGAVEALTAELGRARAELNAERYDGLLARVRDARAQARAIGYAPLDVLALEVQADVELTLEQFADGVTTLRELVQRAATARDDHAETRAWNHLIYVRGYHQGEIDQALALEPAAAAALARAGSPVELQVEQLISVAQVLDQGPRVAEAVERLETARALIARARAHDPSARLAERAIDVLAELANAHAVAGDLPASVAAHREALAGYRDLFGPGSLDEAMVLNNLGDSLRRQGKPEEALAALRAAAEIAEAKTGASKRLATHLMQISYALGELGRWPEAEVAAARATQIARARLSGDDPALATHLAGHASALASLGRRDEARRAFDAAIALYARDPNDINLPIAMFNRGELAFDQQRLADAEADFAGALAAFERLRPDTSMRLYPIVGRARVLVARRAYREARVVLERAVAITPDGADRAMAVAARAWLARALVAGALDAPRGRALATTAARELAALAPTDPSARREQTLLAR